MQGFLGGDRDGLVQGRDDAEDRPVAVAMRAGADNAAAAAVGEVDIVGDAGLDRLAGEGAAVNLGQRRGAVRVEPVMALPDQPVADDAKGITPAIVGGQIAQLAVEQRHRGRYVGDEPRYPLRKGGFRLQAGVCYHGHKHWL